MFIAVTRAFCFWLEIISNLYICIILFYLILFGSGKYTFPKVKLFIKIVTTTFQNSEQYYAPDTNRGTVGLVITQLIPMTSLLQWILRQSAELENQMTSVERVLEYTNLPQESDLQSTPGNPIKS